jgi:hypothetical protein
MALSVVITTAHSWELINPLLHLAVISISSIINQVVSHFVTSNVAITPPNKKSLYPHELWCIT